MEKYTMFLDWKNQYNEHAYITQSSLQIQYNSKQINHDILHRIRTKFFTVFTQTIKPK